jgi:hypothetical protein
VIQAPILLGVGHRRWTDQYTNGGFRDASVGFVSGHVGLDATIWFSGRGPGFTTRLLVGRNQMLRNSHGKLQTGNEVGLQFGVAF